jgi:hypothetical protein
MFRKTFAATSAVALATSGIFSPAPLMAQTGPAQIGTAFNGSCPGGYSRGSTMGKSADLCYADNSKPPMVHKKGSVSDACPSGMRPESVSSYWCTNAPEARGWSAEANLSKASRLTKPSPDVRCPTGWASAKDLKTCYTTLDNPPATRLSKGKPCAANEMDEWGVWCTGDISGVTYAHADGHGTKDFNEVYLYRQLNGGDWESMKCCLSPAAEAYYAANGKGAKPQAASMDGPGDYTSAADDEARARAIMGGSASPCGSAAGAAAGGAVAGQGGAVLGSLLGGLGKKKKKAGC